MGRGRTTRHGGSRRRAGVAALVVVCALAIPMSASASVVVSSSSGDLRLTLDGAASNIMVGGSSDESVTVTELSASGPVFSVVVGAGPTCQGDGTQQITCTSSSGFTGVTIDDDRVPGPRDTVNGSEAPALLSVAPSLVLFSPITVIGSPAGDFLGGSNGPDEIFGGTGGDEISARGGADSVEAFDGESDQVDCGDGLDGVKADLVDQLVNCEYPMVIVDGDVDGYTTEEDCDDKDPAIHPDAVEIPGNDRDEDCDGKDDSPPVDFIDRDSDDDGIAEPEDCDDRDAKIRPGALEIVGNKVDENCDRVVAPFPPIGSSIHSTFRIVGGDRTRVVDLTVTDIPQGAVIQMTCKVGGATRQKGKSCPFSKVSFGFGSGPRQSTDLSASFQKRKLAVGTVITVTVSAPNVIGKQVQFKTRKGKEPSVSTACVEPEDKTCTTFCSCSHL